jgi:hypothetical protein
MNSRVFCKRREISGAVERLLLKYSGTVDPCGSESVEAVRKCMGLFALLSVSLFRQEVCKGPNRIGLLLFVDWNEGGAAKLLILVKF